MIEIFFLDFCERDDGNGKRVASWEKEHGKGIPGISTEINNLPCERKKGNAWLEYYLTYYF